MSSQTIVPCLWMDAEAEAAAGFYVKTFRGGRVVATSHYPASADNPSGKPRGSVLTVELEIAGFRFTALNGGPMFKMNPSVSFFVFCENVPEVDRLFAALAPEGKVLMPLGAYPWSEKYGWVQDRFGVSWQVMAGHRPPGGAVIAPCLMFSDAQKGRAEEAINVYTRIFGGRVEALERYAEGEGPAHLIKHGRFVVAGQDMVAMDSHVSHGVTFNEAISLQVMCADQPEIDRVWAALGEGGQPGPCGWLKDRFGFSWQVVPADIARFIASPDAPARDRAFAAIMKMGKLDLATIDAAFCGRA